MISNLDGATIQAILRDITAKPGLIHFKDYFTLYDFVKAYEHFKDPEWDSEPEVCKVCNGRVCICEADDKPTP
jgi:hypothetical protein